MLLEKPGHKMPPGQAASRVRGRAPAAPSPPHGARGPAPPQAPVAGLTAVGGWQDAHQQVPVPLVAGRGRLGGPARVQQGQVVGVGQGLVAGLGGRALLAVAVQHAGQHGQRRARRGRWGGRGTNAGSFGMNLVVAGQLGSRTRDWRWVGPGSGTW